MRITLLSAGTRGDIQPFIALGQALQTHGARVRVSAMENFVDFVQGYGLEAFPMAGDVTQAMDSTAAQEALQADNPLKFFRSFDKLQTMAQKLQEGFYAACEGSDALVYHPGVAIGYFIAQQMGVPGILAAPFPMTPTRAYPAILFYNGPRFGPTYNRLTHQLFQQGMWMALKNGVKGFWQSRFGNAPRPLSNPFRKQTTASAPTVVSCSQHVFPRPVDWPGTSIWTATGPCKRQMITSRPLTCEIFLRVGNHRCT